MADAKERIGTLEAALGSFIIQTEKAMKKMTQEWGNLANRLGSLAEDIAAPGLAGVIKKYFKVEPDRRMDTLYIRNIKDCEKVREFDVVAVTDKYFFLCEIKSNPRDQYVDEFIDLVKSEEIYNYFPEYRDKILVPVFSSLALPSHVVNKLSKNKILAMALGDEHMQIVNPEIAGHYR